MLELYQAEGCEYSQKVRDKLTDLGLSYVAHNPRLPGHEGSAIQNRQTHEELKAIGGKDQIPFLVDHTRRETRYESDAIISYLETHYE